MNREFLGVENMSISENKSLVCKAYEAISEGNVDGFLDRLSDDVRWTFFGEHKFAKTFVGKQDIIDNMLGPLAGELEDGLRININNVVAEGSYVVVEATGESKLTKGGTYNNIYCYVVKVDNGEIVEMREYLDTELVSNVFGKRV